MSLLHHFTPSHYKLATKYDASNQLEAIYVGSVYVQGFAPWKVDRDGSFRLPCAMHGVFLTLATKKATLPLVNGYLSQY